MTFPDRRSASTSVPYRKTTRTITGLALFRLRRKRPDLPRPYRVVGYPWVPALFVVAMTALVLNTLYERPLQSLLGVGLVALGVPFFRWRRPSAASRSAFAS